MGGRGKVTRRDLVPLGDAVRAWFLISLQTFGGPAGQIAVMHRALVEQQRWIGEKRFLHALNYCMILPGPEAQQLAVYIGWLLNGTLGGVVAGGLFVLPGGVAMLVLSSIYVAYGTTSIVTAVFSGLAPAVLAIVAQAVVRVGKRAVHRPVSVVVAVAAFAALAVFAVPFPLVILASGLVGWVAGRGTSRSTAVSAPASRSEPDQTALIPDVALHSERPSGRRTVKVLFWGLIVWFTPVAVVVLTTGGGSTLTTQGLFFSGTAVVTFGGAYAVLAFVAERAVNVFHWLAPGEMVRGLALAESTPGPLIMVVQFVAFVGAYRNPGDLDPWVAAFIGALLTTWVTFVPSFLFIFLGAPYVERLRGNASISAALSGVTAAVVGVIANLALFFALHTLFTESRRYSSGVLRIDLPVLSSLDGQAVIIALIAAGLIFRLKWSVLRTIGACAAIGVALSVAPLPL
ncbi:MAG: chromate efflux transporter [Nocardioidaceae bacterium]